MGKQQQQQKNPMVKIMDKLFGWVRENTGVCEAADRESLEKENSCLQIKFKQTEG